MRRRGEEKTDLIAKDGLEAVGFVREVGRGRDDLVDEEEDLGDGFRFAFEVVKVEGHPSFEEQTHLFLAINSFLLQLGHLFWST